MRYLLDTHVIIWWLENHPSLPSKVKTTIANPENDILISPISAYEIFYKTRLGKLNIPIQSTADFQALRNSEQWGELSLKIAHATLAGQHSVQHRDPFDRLLAAQAITESMPLITGDTAFAQFADINLHW